MPVLSHIHQLFNAAQCQGFCQVVEAAMLSRQAGASPRSSPPFRWPAPYLGHVVDVDFVDHRGLEHRIGHPVVYLHPADKYHRLTHRPSQEHKGLDERALRASPRAPHSW